MIVVFDQKRKKRSTSDEANDDPNGVRMRSTVEEVASHTGPFSRIYLTESSPTMPSRVKVPDEYRHIFNESYLTAGV